MNTIHKHLSSQTREKPKHPLTIKRSRISKKNMKKQKIPTKPRKSDEFNYSKILYPEFKFHHPMSIFVVGPTNCGKTYFVEQMLSNLDKKMKLKKLGFKVYN